MIDLKKQYQIAKEKAVQLMALGDLNAYFLALEEINRYKRLIKIVAHN